MAKQKKQVITTGNGSTKPILAEGNGLTAGQLQPSQPSTSIGVGSTKPVSAQEALSLLQTICFDLRAMGAQVSILAKGKRLYIILEAPASIATLQMVDGHIEANGKPVLLG